MRPVAIVIDSTTSMPADLVEEYGFTVLPNTMFWEGKEYRDGVDITIDDFLRRLPNAKDFPKTAAISPEAFRAAFEKLTKEGKDVLAVLPTHAMTRVPLAAMEAAQSDFEGEVAVVETPMFGMATGWTAILAARAVREGTSLAACKELAQGIRGGDVGFANRLDLLRAGGRVSRLQAMVGTTLKVKPIMVTLEDGSAEAIERVRTRSRAIDRVVQLTVERAEKQGPIFLGIHHVDAEADAQRVLEALDARLEVREKVISSLNPNPATHFGPGMIGISYVFAPG